MNDQLLSATWRQPPEHLTLLPNTVDVWRGIVDCSKTSLQDLWNILSQEERDRALRFKFFHHRDRYIAARGILRRILGKYLLLEPGTLSFSTGPRGKPYLDDQNSVVCQFNVAHSHDLALYAVSQTQEVGIDVENHRKDIDYERMIPRILTETEASQFWTLPQSDRQNAFFSYWTKKEAYLKARGDGLGFPLKHITVGVTTDQTKGLLPIHGDPDESTRWSLKELVPGPGYSAAVVAAGSGWKIRSWHYST